jgi:hypothetical protein
LPRQSRDVLARYILAPQDRPQVIIIAAHPAGSPATRLQTQTALQKGAQFFSDDFRQSIHPKGGVQIFLEIMQKGALRGREQNRFIYCDFDFQAAEGLPLTRELHAHQPGSLPTWMRVP